MKIEPVPIDEIRSARERIVDVILRTPLVPFSIDLPDTEIWLKLENLQPIGSFKLRGAANAMRLARPEALHDGVVTASAGNMAQGVAWNARRMGVPCTVIVPDHAPATKLAAIERLGGKIVKLPHERWWKTVVDHGHPDVPGFFVHPFSDPAVIAGNGTVGLEILEDLPDADAVLVPYGGGGLSCGIALAMSGSGSKAKTFACEVETAAPFAASLAAGRPVQTDYAPSFVDGIGARTLLDEMWPLASSVLAGSLVASVEQIRASVRLLVSRARVVAEGAGATPLAAALAGKAGKGKIVCVVSGGNIDPETLAEILREPISAVP
ncbi:MAG: pyridoxal-phosphate dependent enzyme [Acidobacteriota bacterium]